MFLKCLELIGFKSFAERTRLEFEPGLTAIVGPNGCGKSNISDAVRWVLGEQSAKALRGSHMEDVIFNGTEAHKPMAMAEVSLTLSDCEQALGTEYHEVTVTRRVFRSGEGQYFINKAPCRLRDIQRLFMDTGIGTNSYSLMEQGRIDMVLSARPDDRREVFEEASGITKFKADKQEALRKLEHTEANLVRLGDIIQEVKKQIISLQRQAGKARRYKALQEQLRRYDLFLAQDRIQVLNHGIEVLESQVTTLTGQDQALREEVAQTEQQTATLRHELSGMEQAVATAVERSGAAAHELDRLRDLITVNHDRLRELEHLSQRDTRESEEAHKLLQQHRVALDEGSRALAEAQGLSRQAEQELQTHAAGLERHEQQTEAVRRQLHELRAESLDLDGRLSRLQNDFAELEARERTTVIRRERLAAEKAEMQRAVEVYDTRIQEMLHRLEELQAHVRTHAQHTEQMSLDGARRQEEARALQQALGDLQSRLAAREAQAEMLRRQEAEAEGFPPGARAALDPQSGLAMDRDRLIGPLAEHLRAAAGYETALQAALRSWLDALVLQDEAAALELVGRLQAEERGSVRALAARAGAGSSPAAADDDRLLNHVTCAPALRDLAERLLGHVRVVARLDAVPADAPPGLVYVTPTGAVRRGAGLYEYWMAEEHSANPVARRHLRVEWDEDIRALRASIEEQRGLLAALVQGGQEAESALREEQRALEEARRALAQCEGQHQVIAREGQQARERDETVGWELEALENQTRSGSESRSGILQEMDALRARQETNRGALASRTEQVQQLENTRADLAAQVTERRIQFTEQRQKVESLRARLEPLEARIRELEGLMADRAAGLNTYRQRMEEIRLAVVQAEGRLAPLQVEIEQFARQLVDLRGRRETGTRRLEELEAALKDQRTHLDGVRQKRSELDVELAEHRMRRQNIIERATGEYHLTPDQVLKEPEPEWENNIKPDRDTLETMVAEIRAKLESLGPVNLVAIEEHQERETRFAFLTQQQDDLVKSKQQLIDLIRKINSTTTEMFSKTFQVVNNNFQDMFKRLFGGGAAKLVLVDEENVLDSGIEIIARPPGKKLQTVSLLSGGERTMTAVALLFALYMVKPSPFCVLDEIDAALDEANIGRFVTMLKDFLIHSQFVVITHNRQTISAANILYGVTMEKHGISKIISVKFTRLNGEAAPPAAAPPPAPAPAATPDLPSS